MRILAIESSCDETAAAVVEDGRKALSSVVSSQIELHKVYGGVVPEIASRSHIEMISQIAGAAVSEAELDYTDLDAIAVTYAPGLIGSLLVGVNFAKGLAASLNVPLIPVHHMRGHIAANYLAFPELTPPFLCLVVSGGHTMMTEVCGYTSFRMIGKTRDDAAGECFDKAARVMGLPYPGGVYLDRAAESGNAEAFHFPHPNIAGSPLDFSFSGMKTAIINLCHTHRQKGETPAVEDLSASFRKAVVEVLWERLLLAIQKTRYDKIALAGGVAANRGLRRKLEAECAERKLQLYLPPLPLCGDNAAMIGAQAFYEYQEGQVAGPDLNGTASLPIDHSYCVGKRRSGAAG